MFPNKQLRVIPLIGAIFLAIALISSVCVADNYHYSVGPIPTPSVAVNTTGSISYYYAALGIDTYAVTTPPSSVVTVSNSALIPNNTISVLATNSGFFAQFFAIMRMKGSDGATAIANRVIAKCPNFQGPSVNTATQNACSDYVDTGADFITALSEASNTVTATMSGELPAAAGCTTGPAPYPSLPYSPIPGPWECCTGLGTSNGQCDYDVGANVTISGATTAGYNISATILTHTISGGHSVITFTDATGSLASCSSQSGCSTATNNPAVIDLTMALPTMDYTGSCKGEVALVGGSVYAVSPCITTNCVPLCNDETNPDSFQCLKPSVAGTFRIFGNNTDTIGWYCP